MVTGAIIFTAFRIAVIDTTVKPFASRIVELFVSHGAKRHAPNNGSVVPLALVRMLVAQNGIVFFASDFRALKPDERVVVRSVNDHVNGLYNMHLHDFYELASNIDLTKYCGGGFRLIIQCIWCTKRHSKCNFCP